MKIPVLVAFGLLLQAGGPALADDQQETFIDIVDRQSQVLNDKLNSQLEQKAGEKMADAEYQLTMVIEYAVLIEDQEVESTKAESARRVAQLR